MTELAIFLKAICNQENDLENTRVYISNLKHVDIIDIFNMINYSKGLGLSKFDFSKFLK